MSIEFIYFYVIFFIIATAFTFTIYATDNVKFKSPVMFLINIIGVIASIYIFDYAHGLMAWVSSIAFIITLFALSVILAKKEIETEKQVEVLLVLLATTVLLAIF